MFQDPSLQLHTIKRAQQEHRDIAERHRLAKVAAAHPPVAAERVVAPERMRKTPAPRRSRLGFRLRLRAG